MRYLLVNHIPAAPGSDAAHLLLPSDWARDVSAAARAAAEAGIALTIATPISDRPIRGGMEIVPDQLGFEHLALPFYDSARRFLHERSAIQASLGQAIAQADVVQLDHGGYPVSLGHIADPIAKEHRRSTLWIVNGESLPRSSIGQSAGNAAKRWVGRSVDSRLQKSLIAHLSSAAKVVCNSALLQNQLADTHGIESECVESMDVLETEIANSAQIETKTKRLLDHSRPLRFVVTGEQNIIAGTEHVLRAMHRCLRLRVPIELIILGDGTERGALLETATNLDIASFVRFSLDVKELQEADVWIDSALTPAAEQSIAVPMARGLAPIVYRTATPNPHVVTVPSGYSDGLSAAMFDATMQREKLVGRMLAGVAFARARTLDGACRRRFELAKSMRGGRSRPAA